MNKFMTIVGIITVTSLVSQLSFANDNRVLELMAISKMAGACGILKLQLDFQDNTQLKGGDNFLARFWSTEASRLGVTLEEYVKTCAKATSAYNQYYNIFSSE